MLSAVLQTCTATCGWVAAFTSNVADGTFAVPIKCNAATRVDIDPLVFETYKRGTYFLLSWLILLMGVEFTFTPWGIVSGFMLVPGGVSGVYAVKNAGIAVSQGTWASLKIMTSFIWGVFIFHETVRTRSGAISAIVTMMLGLWGMSHFSAPKAEYSSNDDTLEEHSNAGGSTADSAVLDESANDDDMKKNLLEHAQDMDEKVKSEAEGLGNGLEDGQGESESVRNGTKSALADMESSAEEKLGDVDEQDVASIPESQGGGLCFGRVKLGKRERGLAAAVFDGLWGGSFLVPLHFSSAKGLEFVISESTGAVVTVAILWLFRCLYQLYRVQTIPGASFDLPSFHFKVMWLPGIISGTLSAIGNVCSILAATSLGFSVGYPISKASLLVSGLWGIFCFKEVRGCGNISGWFVSAFISSIGIAWLSHEHIRS